MTAAGRAHRHHRQSQSALAVALASLGLACLVVATQLAPSAHAQSIGAHLPRSSQAGALDVGSEVSQDPGAAPIRARSGGSHPSATPDAARLDGAALDLRPLPDTSTPWPSATSPTPSSPPASSASPPPADASPVSLPAAVEIPAIGMHSSLDVLGLDDDHRLEVPRDPDVAGWYAGGPRPGEQGAAVFVGHVDWTNGPAVFWRLAELVPGDRVVVHERDGATTTFVVDRLERWPKAEFPTDLVYGDAEGAELRLVTCGGPFDEDARTYRDNIIAFASLAP